MTKQKIICFTHYDLDGAISYLVTKWAHPGCKFECIALSTDIRYELIRWQLKNSFDNYDKVYFLDLDMSENAELIDHDNVILIDHHKTHVDGMNYVKATPIVKEYPSACLLAYKVFKKLYNTKFNDAQKMLILLGNDYDSYENKIPESKILNVVFWNTQKSFESFITNFSKGFVSFTKEQLAIHRIFTNSLSRMIESLKVFQTVFADIDGEHRIIVATFADKHPNDIADYLLETYDADMAIIINNKTNHISLRRPLWSNMRLDAFAKDYIKGGGHEYAAGGTMTDDFLEFTKTLKPI